MPYMDHIFLIATKSKRAGTTSVKRDISTIPSNKSFPAILHIRDFTEHVEPDLTRPGEGLSMQLRVSLNIPEKDVQSDDVEQDDIYTLIRFFNNGNRSDIYQPNAFVYAWGSFLTNSPDGEDFHILLHASSVDRSLFPQPPEIYNLVIRVIKTTQTHISCIALRPLSQS